MSFGSEVNKFSLEPSDGIEDPLGVWLFGPWQRAASWLSALPANRGAVFGGQMFPHLENHIKSWKSFPSKVASMLYQISPVFTLLTYNYVNMHAC